LLTHFLNEFFDYRFLLLLHFVIGTWPSLLGYAFIIAFSGLAAIDIGVGQRGDGVVEFGKVIGKNLGSKGI
jgi:hypothetical protein